jgi:hypothetical protein
MYTGNTTWDVLFFAAMTHRSIEAAIKVLKYRGKEVPSPDVVQRRLRETSTEKLVEDFTPCLEEYFTEVNRRRL